MKAKRYLLFNRKNIFILFCFALFVSCKHETYVTALSIKNSLSDYIEVHTFMKNTADNRSFTIQKGKISVICEINEKDFIPEEMMNNIFDSIKIYDKTSDLVIKFEPDSAYNYKVNPFYRHPYSETYQETWAITVTSNYKKSTFSEDVFMSKNYIFDIKSENVE